VLNEAADCDVDFDFWGGTTYTEAASWYLHHALGDAAGRTLTAKTLTLEDHYYGCHYCAVLCLATYRIESTIVAQLSNSPRLASINGNGGEASYLVE
jgi:hypothetical protein